MPSERQLDERPILATRPGTCTDCKSAIHVNDSVWYNTYRKTVRHVKCKKEGKHERR